MSNKKYTAGANNAMAIAAQTAHMISHVHLAPEHLLLGLVGEPCRLPAHILTKAIKARGDSDKKVDPFDEMRMALMELDLPTSSRFVGSTDEYKEVLRVAQGMADKMKHEFVGPEHLLLAIVEVKPSNVVKMLEHFGIKLADLRRPVLEMLDILPDHVPAEYIKLVLPERSVYIPPQLVAALSMSATDDVVDVIMLHVRIEDLLARGQLP